MINFSLAFLYMVKSLCTVEEFALSEKMKKHYSTILNVQLVTESCQISYKLQLERKSVCKKCLLQNSWICTADLWEVVGRYKPAILMAVGFPRGLFCLQISLSLTPVSSLEYGFQADHAEIVCYEC